MGKIIINNKEPKLANFGYKPIKTLWLGTKKLYEGPDMSTVPLTLTAVGGNQTVKIVKNGSGTLPSVQYKLYNTDWQNYTYGTTISLLQGHSVSFKSAASRFSTSSSLYGQFVFTKSESSFIYASGNCNSLINYSDSVSANCFYNLFGNCISLIHAPELPATTLASGCYYYMFMNCNKLLKAPALPATTLSANCYNSMFEGCTSLTTTPALPATTLALYCYCNMFDGCTSLTTISELPATTLAGWCYVYMFYGCSNLQVSSTQTTEAPYAWRIPNSGTFTNTSQQDNMFSGCAGSRASNHRPGEQGQSYTYYTQNEPV